MGARHDVRVRVSPGPIAGSTELVSVAIRPNVRVVIGSMTASDLALLKQWIELNRDVIIRHWDGDIQFSTDAVAAIKPIRCYAEDHSSTA